MNFIQSAVLRFQTIISWIFCALVSAPATFLATRFFSYKIYHQENLKGLTAPFIMVSNHLSLLDTWFICYPVVFPRFYLKPWRMNWHLPEATNYFRGALSPFMWLNRAIPIVRGSSPKEQKIAKDKIIEILKRGGGIHIFIEGGRSRSGRIENYTTGLGRIYKRVPNCQILPVYIRGMENVLPINVKFPRLYKKVDVVIGKPQKLATEYKGLKGGMDISRQVFDILVQMEKDYFESDQYRAKEILAEAN